jgi:hypothetical protein
MYLRFITDSDIMYVIDDKKSKRGWRRIYVQTVNKRELNLKELICVAWMVIRKHSPCPGGQDCLG